MPADIKEEEGDFVELSIRMEAVAMIFIAVIAMFHLSGQHMSNFRHKLFSWCLVLTEATSALNIITIYTISIANEIPLLLNNILNLLYFFAMNILLSAVAVYAFYVLFEHVPDRHCFYIAVKLITAFFCVSQVVVLTNPWTGWLFEFQDGIYVRGIFNRLSYLLLLIELGMLCMCYLRNRRNVSSAMRRLMHMMPPIVLLLAVVQINIPDLLLNGTIAAVVMLIFYMSFQSNKLYQDSLTELPNRTAFLEELQRRKKKREKIHLLMIHLDQFELVNQKFGMQKGDDMLYLVARYLDQISMDYQAFRFRNTRFILLGTYKGEEAKTALARKIQKRFEEPWKLGNAEYILHYGMACTVADPDEEARQIIDEMEFAVEYAKTHNDGSLICFDQKIQKQFERRAYVLAQLRKAIEKDTLQVYFQPVYDCRTGCFRSAETLVRLWDEAGNFISPGEFIPLAETNGLIDEVSQAVVRKVCAFFKKNPRISLEAVSVNLSVQQMEDITWMNRLQEYIKHNVAKNKRICIEITERIMAENPPLVGSLMQQLGQDGIKFYLDDFGIGYSNLASLLKLPFEVVKIDSSLVRGIETEDKIYQMVLHLIEMLHSAGFQVVAEGTETAEQVRIAKELSIDQIQGYYYAKPMPGDALLRFLQEKNGK